MTIRLEARPDLDVYGRVRTVGRTVRQKSWRNPVKVYKVDIALDRTDSAVMRPAMRFRGEIETGRIGGPAARARATRSSCARAGRWCGRGAALGWREVPVRLGRSNRRQVEIVSGLRGGRPPEPDGPRGRAPAQPRRAAAGAAR